jgi:hypothetical protein
MSDIRAICTSDWRERYDRSPINAILRVISLPALSNFSYRPSRDFPGTRHGGPTLGRALNVL